MSVRINPAREGERLRLEVDPAWVPVYTTEPMDLRVVYPTGLKGAVRSPLQFIEIFGDIPWSRESEIWVIYLNNKNQPLASFIAGHTAGEVDEREVLRAAVLLGSTNFALVLRQGKPEIAPSLFRDVMEGLYLSARNLRLKLLDAVVAVKDGWYRSAREKGELPG